MRRLSYFVIAIIIDKLHLCFSVTESHCFIYVCIEFKCEIILKIHHVIEHSKVLLLLKIVWLYVFWFALEYNL